MHRVLNANGKYRAGAVIPLHSADVEAIPPGAFSRIVSVVVVRNAQGRLKVTTRPASAKGYQGLR